MAADRAAGWAARHNPIFIAQTSSLLSQDKEAAEAQNSELQAQLRQLQEEREAERPQVRDVGRSADKEDSYSFLSYTAVDAVAIAVADALPAALPACMASHRWLLWRRSGKRCMPRIRG